MMARNTLKYRRLDARLRAARRREWNRPVLAPLVISAVVVRESEPAPGVSRRAVDGPPRHECLSRRRLLYALPILLGVNIITFLLFFVVNTPDDMARMQLGDRRVTQEAIDK